MFIKHLMFRLHVLFTIASMPRETAIEHLSQLKREARKLRSRQWAIPFLDGKLAVLKGNSINHHTA